MAIAVYISVVVFTIGALVAQAKGRSALRTAVAALPGFKPSREMVGGDGATGIAVDEQSRKVCLSVSGPPPTTRIVGYKDLLEAEILENGKTVTKTARTSQVGRAVLGGLLLGPVGLLAGALTAKTKSTDKVQRVDLKIVVNDTTRPVHIVNFLQGNWDRTSPAYHGAIATAREWHGLLLVLIQQADREDPQPSVPSVAPSTADELAKLADLRDRGALTPDEFAQQKALLLGKRG
jgi:hypothetical protein